ncbi:MAG: hypothetical protein EOP00_05015 [Pedobacter sp.]|nr:MAG: hypothetical protein EOP00_05015 [Pedobacter sp.]
MDLESYFKAEANRLAKANLTIDKTVTINDQTEEKKVKIANWEQEFSSFIDADINKASWRGAFKLTKNGNVETYISDSKRIPVKKVIVNYQNELIKSVKVFIVNTNDLYVSKDSLTYYPDSLYEIKKTQQIKLMDGKQYHVTGKFK